MNEQWGKTFLGIFLFFFFFYFHSIDYGKYFLYFKVRFRRFIEKLKFFVVNKMQMQMQRQRGEMRKSQMEMKISFYRTGKLA